MTSDPVVARSDGSLVRLRVPPNAEVERFLAGITGVPASSVRVVRGLSARDETVFVGGVEPERVREVLSSPRR